MMNPDPKFRNSEFFQFVQRLHTGQAKIVGNQLVENWEGLWDKQPQEQNFQQIWENSPSQNQLQQAWDASRQAAQDIEEEKLEKVWENLTPEEENVFQQAWDGVEAGSGEMEEFVKMWQTMWPSEETKNEYEFNMNNPYMDDENPMETAHAKIASGEIADAILALEAELTRNPETSEAWRLLGRLHADNDEDSKAIAALSRGFEIDPFNLDFLLNLGISCTNELEREQAIQHLKSWIQHSPDYQHLLTDSTGNTIEDVRGLFEVASYLNPTDSNVHLALGVINFMVRDFDQAIAAFNQAVQANPQDATLWNKLGATLANSGKNSEALDAYHKALELKPNYVRAWVNLGIAYANIKDYQTAARFYLCALSLNPEAAHVWNYLTTSFVCLNRFDLVKKLEMRDPLVYKDEFDVITRADLPSEGPDWTNEFLHE
jgi:peroxin-5